MTDKFELLAGLRGINAGDEEWLRGLLRAGLTKRWHTEALPMGQNVAEHSWGVAMLLFLAGAPRLVIGWALLHDLPEETTGDSPAPEKRHNPALRDALKDSEQRWFKARGLNMKMTEDELAIIKRADRLEARLWLENAFLLTGSPYIQMLAERQLRWEKDDAAADSEKVPLGDL